MRATNPKGKEGKVLTCHNCGSFLHFVRNCPDAKQKEDALVTETTKEDEEEVVLSRFRPVTRILYLTRQVLQFYTQVARRHYVEFNGWSVFSPDF